jgi:DNA-binding XRE family transcriptional regulator
MKTNTARNHLRTHRNRSGLSQRDLGLLLDRDQGEVSRHERSVTTPSLAAALCYEVVFRVPTSDLFPGIHTRVIQIIESKLAALEDELGQRSARDRGATLVAKKLTWLKERKGR